MEEIAMALMLQARTGDQGAIKLLFQYVLGKPTEAVDPDRLDVDQWQKLQESARPFKEMKTVLDGLPAQWACGLTNITWPCVLATTLKPLRDPPPSQEAQGQAADPPPMGDGSNGSSASVRPSTNGGNGAQAPRRAGGTPASQRPSPNGRNDAPRQPQPSPNGKNGSMGQGGPSPNGGNGGVATAAAPSPNGANGAARASQPSAKRKNSPPTRIKPPPNGRNGGGPSSEWDRKMNKVMARGRAKRPSPNGCDG
jgi:hypothetical protein